jgi:hypothetical protein
MPYSFSHISNTTGNTKNVGALAVALVAAFGLTACSSLIPEAGFGSGTTAPATSPETAVTQTPAPNTGGSALPETTATQTPAQDTGGATRAPVQAGVLAPGETTTGTGVLLFEEYGGKQALLSHRVVAIELVSGAERARLLEKAPELNSYDLYAVHVASAYVSGDALPYSSFSRGYGLVDVNGARMQSVALIGYDFCDSDTTIPAPGNNPDAVIRSCNLAVVPPGGPLPAGISWHQMDTAYDRYDGKPALILKG